jgi:endonuclease/exonuclease/phosphatase family metal-dependent hydrolase
MGGSAAYMKRLWMMRLLSTIICVLALLGSEARAQASIRTLSFNIRYGSARDGDHVWPNRRAHVITTIRDHAPHLLGVQEALKFQLDEIVAALPIYRVIGVGRDDGMEKGEYAAILVDTSRFVVIESGQFWFSDTPNVAGSKHWGNNITRLATWALLADRATGDTVRFFNQHWDHESQPSRLRSARMMLDRATPAALRTEPIIVMGDFNSGEDNAAFRALVSDAKVPLRDTYRALHATAKVVGTFSAFKGDSLGDKIDAILVSPQLAVIDAGIDRRRFGALWASDHFAVSATVRVVRATRGQRSVPCTSAGNPPGCRAGS